MITYLDTFYGSVKFFKSTLLTELAVKLGYDICTLLKNLLIILEARKPLRSYVSHYNMYIWGQIVCFELIRNFTQIELDRGGGRECQHFEN